MNLVNVCLSCDDNYSKYAGVVIASILDNLSEKSFANFYILDGNITKENKDKLLHLKQIKDCNIEFIQVDESKFEVYKQINTHKYITLPSYYRLKLSELLPNVDKIIYLDCDMIVNSDITELFNIQLGDNIIGGVLDTRVKHKKKWKNTNYINAGMIVFNLAKIRENKIEDKFVEYTKQNTKTIETGDQDVINFVLKDKIQILPDDWNVQVSGFASRTSFTNKPKLIHYIGCDKPWVFASITFFKDLYFKNLQLTPWALTEEEKQKWIIENKKASRKKFWKKRPLCFLHPKYLYAFYCSYIKK